MKRTILAGAAALALLAAPASAQWIVHDPGSNMARIMEAARALQQAIQQYEQLRATYNAIAHQTDLSGLANTLGGLGRTYMPQASRVPGLLGGQGSWGQANGFMQQDRLYDMGNADPAAREMQRREQATANAKAIAAAGLTDAEDRIARLEAMKARLEAAQDGTEVEAVTGYLALEQQHLAAHQAQIEQARLLLAAEDRVERQREEQALRRSADDLRRKTQPLTDTFQ